MHASNEASRYPVLSLFSGGMGLDVGLAQAGLDIRMAQELDGQACQTIRQNGHPVLEGDLRAYLQKSDGLAPFLAGASLAPEEPFALVGGPPCQSFSTAGKRGSVDDERGMLVFDFVEVVRRTRPRFAVLENVKGLLSSTDAGGGPVLDAILKRFKEIGYTTVWGLVDAVHYGAPQFRERLVVIASRDGEPVFVPVPTHFPQHQDAEHRWVTLKAAIGDLESDPGPCARFSPRVQEILRLVPEGGNWRSLPPDIAEEAMGGAWKSGGGKVGFFRRVKYSEPSPTLVTSPVQKATLLAHPTQLRPLSVREYARIQGFPDEWQFSGPIASQYKQIGNAVPTRLGRAIGAMLKAVAEGDAVVETKRTRGTSAHDVIDLSRLVVVA